MKSNIIKILVITLSLAIIITILGIRFVYWQHQQRYPVSSVAIIQANLIPITSQIDSTVTSIHIKNHMLVKRGDLLCVLNDIPLKLAVTKAEQELTSIKQEINKQRQAVIRAEKLVEEQQAKLSEISKQAFQGDSFNKLPTAEVKLAEMDLEIALQQLAESMQHVGKRGEAKTQIKAAEEVVKKARLNLQQAYLAAPTNGYIDYFPLKIGSKVTAKKPLFNLIENNEWWVTAYFKDSALKRIKPNQPAIIKLQNDRPEHFLHGIVEQTSSAGVKIKILNPTPNDSLSIGLRGSVIIDTSPKSPNVSSRASHRVEGSRSYS